MRAVPRDDVMVRCPRCEGLALIRRGVARCADCAWSAGGATAGRWCACCEQWEGDEPRPAVSYTARVTYRCSRCGKTMASEQLLRRGQHPASRPCDCGATCEAETVQPRVEVSHGVDALYGLPFYLSTPCAGHTLWAANLAHLEYLEKFIAATIRPAGHDLGHRLPGWMLSRRHRATVLRGLSRLRARSTQLSV
jgi:hypothetical protein